MPRLTVSPEDEVKPNDSLQWRPGLLPRLTWLTCALSFNVMGLQWRPGLLPRLTPTLEAWPSTGHNLQWRPGLLPRLTLLSGLPLLY